MIKLILILVLIVSIGVVFEQADGINEIKGYVSEAKKKKAQAEEEAKEKTQPEVKAEVKAEIEEVVGVIRPTVSDKTFGKIIGIQLSRTCLQMEKFNVSSNCPTYKDLLQFDNTVKSMSGDFTNESGVWLREQSKYKKHCNFYHPSAFPLLLVVDPDGCWFRERGISTVTIQAISPEKMLYKLTADREVVEQLREFQRDQTEWQNEKQDSETLIDKLEIAIENKEFEIERLEDKIDDLDSDSSGLERRNLQFQLRFANDKLVDLEKDLKEEEIDFENLKVVLSQVKGNLTEIKTTKQSRLVIGGEVTLGVGRYVEECRFAQVGADMQLIVDTINYLISKCESTDFDSRKTSFIEQTPINIMDHKFYQFQKWQKEAIERCKVKC